MIETLEGLLFGKAGMVLLALALLFSVERLFPAAAPPAAPDARGRLLRNLAVWAATALVSLLLVAPLTLWAAGIALAWRPDWWRGWQGTLLDLLLLDCLIYWWHRANHAVPFLWRFHRVHHLDRTLDTTTALRFHPGEVLLSAMARAGIILLLGLPLASVILFETLVLLAALFHHSNLRLPPRLERPLSRILVTPSIHWVHHRAVRRDTDSNYATLLSLWDRLFASRSPTPRSPQMAIGVERERDLGLLQLFLLPFAARPSPPATDATGAADQKKSSSRSM
ncbi:MAG: sterol desaturase family protein [Rhodospirillales bacterium]|nr:sterol desaturase family protein [Rhodospirillales bacterium]